VGEEGLLAKPAEDFARKVREFRRNYLASFPDKLRDLEALLDRLVAGGGTDELEDLKMRLHRLKGSAGTYGLPAAGAAAAEWEETTEGLLTSGAAPSPPELAAMRSHLDSMGTAFREESGGDLPAGPQADEAPPDAPRILLVEDDPDLLPLLAATLESFGYRVTVAKEVKSAAERFRAQPPDLVVTDYYLPGGDAKALLEIIRHEDAEVPVLLLSGMAGREELAGMFRESVDEFISKPVNPGVLRAALQRLLLVREERRRIRERALSLLELSSTIRMGMSAGEVFSTNASVVPKITPFRCAQICAAAPDGISLRVAAQHGDCSRLPEVRTLDLLRTLHAIGFRCGDASFLPTELLESAPALRDPTFDHGKSRRRTWRPEDHLIVEIAALTRSYGFLRVSDPADGMRPSQDSMQMLALLAHWMAGLIVNTEAYEFEKRVIQRLEAVSEVVQSALHASDPDTVAALVVQAAVNRMGSSFCALFLRLGEEGGWTLLRHAVQEMADPEGPYTLEEATTEFLDEAAATGQPVHRTGPLGEPSYVGRVSCRTSLAVPVSSAGTVRFVLALEDDSKEEFDISELNIFLSLGHQLGLILDNLLNQSSLERATAELRASNLRLQDSNAVAERLQNALRQYLPASTFESVLKAPDGSEPQYIESLTERPIMFVDVVGFTRVSESGGPIYVVELLNRYFSFVGNIISRSGGEVIKYIGDGIMAYFDGADASILAARDIIRGRSQLNLELASAGIGGINLRVGVAWGPALLCHVGPSYHKDRTLLGDTVNTAARLESNARPGTALLDARLLQGRHPTPLGLAILRGALTVKGKQRSLQVMTFTEDMPRYETAPEKKA
jgi:class 3 adenylate cyclase/CheY-like chemotaxis protein